MKSPIISSLLAAAACNPLVVIPATAPRLGYFRWQGRCLTLYGPNLHNRSPKLNFRLTQCPPSDTQPALVSHGWAVYPDDRITALSELHPRDNTNETRYLTSTYDWTVQPACGDLVPLELLSERNVEPSQKSYNGTDMGQTFVYDAENKWLVWKRDLSRQRGSPTSRLRDAQLCYKVNNGPESAIDVPEEWEEWESKPGMALTRCVTGDEEKWDFVESTLKAGELKAQFKGME